MSAQSLIWLVFSGCTHQQLRYNTLRQAETTADLYTQQVLDNLAKFSSSPEAVPHFSYPSATSSGVDDSIDGGLDFRFSPSRLSSWGLGSNGRRLNKQNLTIIPISDPRKLELMRCVYQQAVGYHSGFEATGECPSCDLRLANFYFGSPTPEKLVATTDSGVPIIARKDLDGRPYGAIAIERDDFNEPRYRSLDDGSVVVLSDEELLKYKNLYVDATIPEITRRKGIVTSACVGSCWFKQGDKKPSIRTGSCCQVGHYCGHYVWVPEFHRDELSKLTLVILDIALNDPPTKPSSNAQPVQVSFEIQARASSDEGEKIAVESMSDQSQTRGELPVQSLQRFKAKLFDVPPLPENEASKTPFDSGILLDRLRLDALTN